MGRVLQKRRGSHQAPTTTNTMRHNAVSSHNEHPYDQHNQNGHHNKHHGSSHHGHHGYQHHRHHHHHNNRHNRNSESGLAIQSMSQESHTHTNAHGHIHSHTNSVTTSLTHGITAKSAHVIPDSTTNVSSLSEQAIAKEDEDPMRLYVCIAFC